MILRPRTRIRRRGLEGYQNIQSRQRLKEIAWYLGLIFVFALFWVWTRVQVIETRYEIRRLQEAGEKLKADNHTLMVEAAMLRSPGRLNQIARKMGLHQPKQDQVYFVRGVGKLASRRQP